MAKNFLDEINPVYRFIGAGAVEPEQQEQSNAEQSKAEQSKAEPKQPEQPKERIDGVLEVKSRRTQIVLQPSLYEKARERAKRENISFNEIIHRALKEYLQ